MPFYMIFVDFSKALYRKAPWNISGKLGCPDHFKLVSALHSGMKVSVRLRRKQGCVLAPNTFLDFSFDGFV